jgi:imidazolonepropionase-like amidohydrolase
MHCSFSTPWCRRVACSALVAALPLRAEAQDTAASFALRGATVHTAAGPALHDATIVVENGKISAVGTAARVPAGMRVIDVRGKQVIPGMIDNHSHVGRGQGAASLGPTFRMVEHIDEHDPKWRVALSGGVTTVVTGPGGGSGIGGEAVVVKTFGFTFRQRILKENGGMKLAAGRREPRPGMTVAALFRAMFLRAQEYNRKWQQWETAGRTGTPPARDPGLEAFAGILRREDYVRVHVNGAHDIMMMLELKDEFGFDLALHHAVEAYQVVDEIAKRRVDVVTLPLFLRIPISEDAMQNAAVLSRAGVRFAFHQDDPISSTKWLRFNGALAMRYGLPEAEALKGLTIYAAEIARISDRVGSIAPGKDADLVVLNGPWYELVNRVDMVFVDGVIAYDRSQEKP